MRKSVQVEPRGKSLTRQSERDRADINRIVKRGIVPPDPNTLQFGDFSSGMDFQAAQDRIAQVTESFDSLPAEDRYFFANDPANMLEFMSDPENHDECVEMGLLEPSPPSPPSPPSDSPSPSSKPGIKVNDVKDTKQSDSDSSDANKKTTEIPEKSAPGTSPS